MKQHSHDRQEEVELLHHIQDLLDTGQAGRALETLITGSRKQRSKALVNAYGVCLMRTEQIEQANSVFRNLVLSRGGFSLDAEAPTVFKTNYATALLLGTHVDGCISVLSQIHDTEHSSFVKLQKAIDQWKRTLNPLRRWLIPILGWPDVLVPLPFPPGDLWIKEQDRPTTRAA